MATQQVKPKKIYIPVDGIQRHEEFECWYEDGSLFCTVTGDFKAETDKVHLLGRTGGEIARIKPDHKALTMDVRVDKWTYRLRTYVIFKHYFFEGMLWQMFGSISNGRANFRNEDTSKNDVHIVRLRDFKGHGPCYEVRERDSQAAPRCCRHRGHDGQGVLQGSERGRGRREDEPRQEALAPHQRHRLHL